MWYLSPIPDEEAQGQLRELYDHDLAEDGYVSNTTRAWSQRPELYPLWSGLLKGIRSRVRLRTYELVTLAASRAIGCVF